MCKKILEAALAFTFISCGGMASVSIAPAAIAESAASLEAVQVNNCTNLVVKPRTLNLTCDGAQTFLIDGKEYAGSTGRLSRLVWATWGPRQAKGTGVLVTAGSGTIRRNVQVTLSKVRKQNGIAVFAEGFAPARPSDAATTCTKDRRKTRLSTSKPSTNALLEREIRTSTKTGGLIGTPRFSELRNCPAPIAPRILDLLHTPASIYDQM